MADDLMGQLGIRFIRDEDGNLMPNPEFFQNIQRGPWNRGDFDGPRFGGGNGERGPRRRDEQEETVDPVHDTFDLVNNYNEGFDFNF